MRTRLFAAVAAAALLASSLLASSGPMEPAQRSARQGRIPVGKTSLFYRDVGRGEPLVVLHGGPDFDHEYLLPDLDRLSDAFRLIYYDQRGRGQSAAGVQPEDVTLLSDVDDLKKVTEHFRLESASLLGHSWGAVLALEYAIRYPSRVSHLILMNPAPASARDLGLMRKYYLKKIGAEMNRQLRIVNSAAYKSGDPEAVAARYRIHFKPALNQPEHYERLMAVMKARFVSQGREGILKTRAIEDRLMRDTWQLDGYDLLPKLATLQIPTLVIYGDHDFIPADVVGHIAGAMPNARMVTLKNCGHFTFLECPGEVRGALTGFFRRATTAARQPH